MSSLSLSSDSSTPLPPRKQISVPPESVQNTYDPLWFQPNFPVGRTQKKIDEIGLDKNVPVFSNEFDDPTATTPTTTSVTASKIMNNLEIVSILKTVEEVVGNKIQETNAILKSWDPSQLPGLFEKCSLNNCVAKPDPFPPNGTIAIFDNAIQNSAGGLTSSRKFINDAPTEPSDSILFSSAQTNAEIEKRKVKETQIIQDGVNKFETDIRTELNGIPWLSKIRPAWFVTAKCSFAGQTTPFAAQTFPKMSAYFLGEVNSTFTTGLSCTGFTVIDGNRTGPEFGCSFDASSGLLTFTKKTALILTFGMYFRATNERNHASNSEQPTCFIIVEEKLLSGYSPVHIIRGPEPSRCANNVVVHPGATETSPVVLVGAPTETFQFMFIKRILDHDPDVVITMSAIELPRKWAFQKPGEWNLLPSLSSTAVSSWTDWKKKISAYEIQGTYVENTALSKPHQTVSVRATVQMIGVGFQPDHLNLNSTQANKFSNSQFPSLTDPTCLMCSVPSPIDHIAYGNTAYVNAWIQVDGTKQLTQKPYLMCTMWTQNPTNQTRTLKTNVPMLLVGGKASRQIDSFTIEISNGGSLLAVVDIPLNSNRFTIILQISENSSNFYDGVLWCQIGTNSPTGRLLHDIPA